MTDPKPQLHLTIPFTSEAIRNLRGSLNLLQAMLDGEDVEPGELVVTRHAPEKEEKPKPKAKAKGRARKEDTPVDPGTEASSSVEDMRTQMLMLLAENFGTGRPPKALKDILAEFDATSARDIKDEHIAEAFARIKALVSGVLLDRKTEPAPDTEKTETPNLADDIEDLL
jgi:hypothetical protein